MYFDLDDYRPETPRVPRAISAREGGILSFFFHFLLVAAVVFLPDRFAARPQPAPVLVPKDSTVRYVHMAPLVDRSQAPRFEAESSDLDRRSATRQRAEQPQNAMPFSRGNTPDRTEAIPEERKAGPETRSPSAAPPSTTPPAESTLPRPGAPAITVPAAPPAASGNLGDALRNLKQYLQDQNFDNQRGGNTDQSADIQFDSKGADFGPWLRRFRNQVMRNWLIPEAAMWQRGRVVIQFFVLRNGTILELRVVGPSTIDSFNLSALNALRMSNPTMELPPDYPGDRVFFTVTFHYNDGQDR